MGKRRISGLERDTSRSVYRGRESRLRRWALVHGKRRHVALAVLVALFVGFLAIAILWPVQFHELASETAVLQTVFNTMLSGVILLVSIVVAVAGMGVSQDLTTIGQQSDRVDEAIAFREGLTLPESVDTRPAQTGAFLGAVLYRIEELATRLDDARAPEGPARDRLTALLVSITSNAGELLATLERVESGTTEELLVGLDYDASWQLYQCRSLLTDHGESFGDAEREALEELAETLRYFLIGREYFKSLYYMREFSNLSRGLLVISLPVIGLLSIFIVTLEAGLTPGVAILGVPPVVAVVILVFTLSLAPYVLLAVYVFRAASITTRTIAAGPFVHGTEYEERRSWLHDRLG